jgi:hypothetical protein
MQVVAAAQHLGMLILLEQGAQVAAVMAVNILHLEWLEHLVVLILEAVAVAVAQRQQIAAALALSYSNTQ